MFQCGLCVDSSADVWWLCFSVACVLTVAVLMCGGGGCVSMDGRLP